MARNKQHSDTTDEADANRIGGGPGASDANSGGGNATGTPDAETGMVAEDVVSRGDVAQDRERLFPGGDSVEREDASSHANEGSLKAHGDKFEEHLPGRG
ncbi:MAG TPA: hypothetical protein VEA69_23795 [Tepidisphaeraceae bacterium]|nr:hypothetical protein [Tepidisphaeraceae bacterium]